jgi:hypothetical protein
VVDEARSRDKGFLQVFRNTKKTAETTKQLTALEERWSSEAKTSYARAVSLAQQAGALAK